MMLSDPHHWLHWAQRIQAIAQTGLTYSKDPFDLERFAELNQLAMEALAAQSGIPAPALTPLFEAEKGYPTPKSAVRAVVFDDQGRMLLIRETADGLWSPPGGWADIGESPAEMVVREVREESGYEVKPVKLLAVVHRASHTTTPVLWDAYTLFIRCELVGGAPRSDGLETSQVDFFHRDNLPPLSLSRATEAQVLRMFVHHDHPHLPTDFD